MAKEQVIEKTVETVAEKAEPVVEAVAEPAKAILPKFTASNPKIVVGTVVVVGGILVGGYFIKKKLDAKKAAKAEEVEPAKGDE